MQHLILMLALLLSASTQEKTQHFRARLSTVPIDVAMQSTIAGRGTVTARLVGRMLTIAGEFAELKTPATFAKIHLAPKGIRGPAVFDLTITPARQGTLAGTFALAPEQVEHLMHSRFYIQLHSEKAPDGNLWGWLLPLEARR